MLLSVNHTVASVAHVAGEQTISNIYRGRNRMMAARTHAIVRMFSDGRHWANGKERATTAPASRPASIRRGQVVATRTDWAKFALDRVFADYRNISATPGHISVVPVR
jgi:hypothetical protein